MDKIRAIPILDVAEKLGIDVQKKGTRYMACCLWHPDSHPSMQIGGRQNNCHCYSCGETHNAIDLIMKHQNTDFIGACRWLESNGWDIKASPDLSKGEEVGWRMRRLEALQAKRRSGGETSSVKPTFRMGLPLQSERFLSPENGGTEGGYKTIEGGEASFVICLTKVFGDDVARDVALTYCLASQQSRYGWPDVMFPLIDKQGRVRDIKVQGYECDERSERFFHGNGTCYWLGPTLTKEAEFDRECLFGEHLLRKNPDRTIILVESPKNACVGYAQYPQYLWLATGNKNQLKREVLEVLKGRNVVVFPDNDAYDDWAEKLEGMKDIAMFTCMRVPGAKGKEDIADWIINDKKVHS